MLLQKCLYAKNRGKPISNCIIDVKISSQLAHIYSSTSTFRVSSLRLSGLFIRRKSDREFHSYIPLLDYNSSDYEVLLRLWGSEPFPHHLGAFSGPLITGEDPQETLLKKSNDWTKDLASKHYFKLCKSSLLLRIYSWLDFF